MADKLLLKKSIDDLEHNNSIILKRLAHITNKKKIEELNYTLAKNNSIKWTRQIKPLNNVFTA